jgi:hypothetical protein
MQRKDACSREDVMTALTRRDMLAAATTAAALTSLAVAWKPGALNVTQGARTASVYVAFRWNRDVLQESPKF